MKVQYPPDELIDTYETLNLSVETEQYATYTAPDRDFLVKAVVIDKQYWKGRKTPDRIVISTAVED